MQKKDRMRQQAELMRSEKLAETKDLLADAGVEFTDHELPPDEVEDKEVQKSMLQSLRTMIPYTDEWYEAKAAEEEMDDLKAIRIERVKASDFSSMAKMGRHEEALTRMMSDSNNDFFFFNKLKFKMEAEGKWKYGEKGQEDALVTLSRGSKRNRLKKAANALYGAFDVGITAELARMSTISTGAKK
mmetsp:Transcript_31513/g.71585  ORF Transcript_31513/g.71585 Transcript_31513/m.71585 type:complete len:187 (+) Transcript_31513:179-739(+)